MAAYGYGVGYGLRARGARSTLKPLELPAGANGVYALHRVSGHGGPCLRVVRASDNATLDLGFAANGLIDAAAALAFRGSSRLFVDIWYDQSGLGNHATQTTTANRPTFVPENAWEGLPSVTFDSGPGGSGPSKHLNLPASLTFDRQNHTVFCVAATNSSWNSNAIFELGTTTTTRCVAYNDRSAAFRMISDTGGSLDMPKTIQCRPSLVGYRFMASGVRGYLKGASYNFTARAPGTATGGRIGGSIAGIGFNYRGETTALISFARGLADAEIAALQANLARVFPTAAPRAFAHNIVVDGDSISEGYGATDNRTNIRQTLRTLGLTVDHYNQAVFGTASDVIFNARVAKHSGIDRVAAPGKNILVFGVGSNDINANAAATTIWSGFVLPYIRYAMSLGYVVIVGTVLPRNTIASMPARETERIAFNTLIRDNAAAEGYRVADYAAIPDLANPANTTYYLDGTHPTSLGYARMSAVLTPLIQAALTA